MWLEWKVKHSGVVIGEPGEVAEERLREALEASLRNLKYGFEGMAAGMKHELEGIV